MVIYSTLPYPARPALCTYALNTVTVTADTSDSRGYFKNEPTKKILTGNKAWLFFFLILR